MKPLPAAALALLIFTALSCSSSSAGPPAAACSSSLATSLHLNVGAYAAINPVTNDGCIDVAANSSADSAEYLLVAQSAGGVPGTTAPYTLRSGGLPAGVAAALIASSGQRSAHWPVLRQRGAIAAAFDRRLRAFGARTAQRVRAAGRRALAPPPGAVSGPPGLGTSRSFSVCADYSCATFKTVTATVQAVGTHVVVYVDNAAPLPGLSATQIDSLQRLFDRLYAVDTVAFGGISDIDSNHVVLTLMTGVVNSLVSAASCETGGYVAGFFLSDDLDPTAPHSNGGEIFYTVVPDPNGTLSCPHTTDEVFGVLPTTFLHELQHVISFNQHALVRGGDAEDLWLDEALSSFAEELGGRSFLPDSDSFFQYTIADLFNAYAYLADPPDHFLLQESDTVLADFGAGWLYIRYLADQFGQSITTKLEATTYTGTSNIAVQTGLPFDSTVTRWSLANWVSDLPGFAPTPVLQYTSWSFRPLFAELSAADPLDFPLAFPLVPHRAAATALNLSGTLSAGSAAYARALQGPGAAGFTVLFAGNAGPIATSVVPELGVVRIR